MAPGGLTEPASAPRLTAEQVWNELEKASFAVISYVRPKGRPSASGSCLHPPGCLRFPSWWKPAGITVLCDALTGDMRALPLDNAKLDLVVSSLVRNNIPGATIVAPR